MSAASKPPGRPKKPRLAETPGPTLILTADELAVVRAIRAANAIGKDMICKTAVRYAEIWPGRPRPGLRLIVSKQASGV